MPELVLIAADLVAVAILAFGLYFPRHRRRDLLVAYLGVNVGVLAVSAVLADSTVSAGLGLGLFGVLSIIRLRSSELGQREVAYYFSALALGLLGGLPVSPAWLSISLMSLVLVVMAIGDHPRLLAKYDSRHLVLDRAFTDDLALQAHLAGLLSTPQAAAVLHEVDVQKIDLVNDTTVVEVRYHTRQEVGVPSEPAMRTTGVTR
jgi:hypothetical protein